MRRCCCLLLALVLLAAGGLAALVFFYLPSLFGRAEPQGPPPLMPLQIEELQAKIATGRHGEPYSLKLTDPDLSALLASYLASDPNSPFSPVKARVVGDRVVVDGMTKGPGISLPVRATVAVSASGGRPVTRVENVSLGDVPLPGPVRDQVVSQVSEGLDLSRYNLPITVENVELGPGTTAVRGRIK